MFFKLLLPKGRSLPSATACRPFFRHEELLADGLLTEFHQGHCIFVSHQWLSGAPKPGQRAVPEDVEMKQKTMGGIQLHNFSTIVLWPQ